MTDKPKITDDGYEIIEPPQPRKGVQCGICGMRFDDNKAYGYWCSHQNCPIQMRVTS